MRAALGPELSTKWEAHVLRLIVSEEGRAELLQVRGPHASLSLSLSVCIYRACIELLQGCLLEEKCVGRMHPCRMHSMFRGGRGEAARRAARGPHACLTWRRLPNMATPA